MAEFRVRNATIRRAFTVALRRRSDSRPAVLAGGLTEDCAEAPASELTGQVGALA